MHAGDQQPAGSRPQPGAAHASKMHQQGAATPWADSPPARPPLPLPLRTPSSRMPEAMPLLPVLLLLSVSSVATAKLEAGGGGSDSLPLLLLPLLLLPLLVEGSPAAALGDASTFSSASAAASAAPLRPCKGKARGAKGLLEGAGLGRHGRVGRAWRVGMHLTLAKHTRLDCRWHC